MRGVPRARRAISAAPLVSSVHAEDPRRALDDLLQVLGRVVVEPLLDLEAVAQAAR